MNTSTPFPFPQSNRTNKTSSKRHNQPKMKIKLEIKNKNKQWQQATAKPSSPLPPQTNAPSPLDHTRSSVQPILKSSTGRCTENSKQMGYINFKYRKFCNEPDFWGEGLECWKCPCAAAERKDVCEKHLRKI